MSAFISVAQIECLELRRLFAAGADQIVYDEFANPTGVYIANSDGNNATRIPITAPNPQGASFTPDRSGIIFTSQIGGQSSSIWEIGVDGSNETQLTTETSAFNFSAKISPDGNRIVFVSNRDGNDEIYTMDANGGDVKRLTFDSGNDNSPSFSPDGTKILFSSNRSGNYEIYTMDAATGLNLTRLTNNAADDESPTYSPEGRRIAFSSNRGGESQIYMMAATGELAGATPNKLTTTTSGHPDTDPTFSPDGTLLAYAHDIGGGGVIPVISADTGAQIDEFGGLNSEVSDPGWNSAATFAGISFGVVTVNGTAGSDLISIANDSMTLTVTLNGKSEQFSEDHLSGLQIFAGDGNDTVDGSQGAIAFYASGDAGNDELIGGQFNDTLTAGAGRNTLFGGDGDDRLNGSGGRDFLYGENGNDRMYGNAGNDYMVGGAGVDRMWGGDGDDLLSGNSGNDKMYGEAGNDQLLGGDGNDICNGGLGIDTLNGQKGTDGADNDAADLRIAIEVLI